MSKKNQRIAISWGIIVALIISLMPGLNFVHALGGVAQIENTTTVITQNGVPIPENGTLSSTDPIEVTVSFDVPVQGDNPTPANPVVKGDKVTIPLSNAFKLNSANHIVLKHEGVIVGHVKLNTDPITKMVSAEVIFDGDDQIFDGTVNTVKCEFYGMFTYDSSGAGGAPGDHVISILGKNYTIQVPHTPTYTMNKTANVDLHNKSIEWTIDIEAKKGSSHIDLADTTLKDDFSDVGKYINGSFKVGGVAATPNIAGNTFSYKFPSNSMSPIQVKYKTEIKDEIYYSFKGGIVKNKASLLDDKNKEIASDSEEVPIDPKWIKKVGKSNDDTSGGTYTPGDREVTWEITINELGKNLNGVIIRDVLANELTFQSAKWQAWNGSSWGSANSIVPNAQGEYNIGNINSMVKLTIISKYSPGTHLWGVTAIKNTAGVKWDEIPTYIDTDEIRVLIGFDSIRKTGTLDKASQKIKWNITVNTKGQSQPDLRVYDLIVYKSQEDIGVTFPFNDVTGFPPGVGKTSMYPSYSQRLLPGTITLSTGLTQNVYPLYLNGERIADLLEITGISSTKNNVITFETEIMDYNFPLSNTKKEIINYGRLFKGKDKYLRNATRKIPYDSKVLSKEMLKQDANKDYPSRVNTSLTKVPKEGFDYEDKSVVFRLSINADGINMNKIKNSKGEEFGDVYIEDVLPDGWEFVDIEPGNEYLVFNGTGNADGTVTASSTTPITLAGLTAAISGKNAKFTFNQLDKPYVILVKAKPSEALLKDYFGKNKETLVTNNLTLKGNKWTENLNVTQDVSIKSEILKKDVVSPKAAELKWTIEYKPCDTQQPIVKIEDIIPNGIELRIDDAGKFIFNGENYVAEEMNIKADGTYSVGGKITLIENDNISYDPETRILTFVIPDKSKAYRLRYITDITGEPGEIKNNVRLLGTGTEQENTLKPYMITILDGKASFKRDGWIEINKTDQAGNLLPNAEFSLYGEDGITFLRKGKTDATGKLYFKVIPEGEYFFKETSPPPGYVLNHTMHSLKVLSKGGKIISSIDGKTGPSSNQITIINNKMGNVGNLEIKKQVSGTGADKTKKFEFTINLIGDTNTYSYRGNGVPHGMIKDGDKIDLAHDESITIMNLPENLNYKVTEKDYKAEKYKTSSVNDEGSIVANTTITSVFTNKKNTSSSPYTPPTITHNPVGELKISKTVKGDKGDKSKKFEFTINLIGDSQTYEYKGEGVSDGTVKNGDVIFLAHGESIIIKKLPKGTEYKITEKDYKSDGYDTFSSGITGKIAENEMSKAEFINVKPDDSDPNNDIDNGNKDKDKDDKINNNSDNKSDLGKDNKDKNNTNINKNNKKNNVASFEKTKNPKTSDSSNDNTTKSSLIILSIALALLVIIKLRIRSARKNV